jgi:hypothetical protein
MDEETKRLLDFTYVCLDVAEEEVKEIFDGNPYAEEAMYMNMTYALAFRLMSNGNWEKNELKRWMGERVEDATETLLELEAEENSRH